MEESPPDSALLKAILLVLLEERAERLDAKADTEKAEMLLLRSGMTVTQIASLLGKQPGAVTKTVQRAKAKG